MLINPRLENIGDYPFDRLRALIGGIKPPTNLEPISLSLGEPQHNPPDFIKEIINRESIGWGKYPPVKGTSNIRYSIANWLTRRYQLPEGMIEPETMIIPVSGTREALFMIALAAIPEKKNGTKPVVLMPNPFYQVYLGATIMAGAKPVLVPTNRENGFLPDYTSLPKATLDSTALAYFCSPSNPQGAIAPVEMIFDLVQLARAHDFLLVSDECYSELYYGSPPAGAAEACNFLDGTLQNVVIMNSLSKRSNVPGLRSGFVSGPATLIERFARLRDYGGAPAPLPLLAAASALWLDETHVEKNRTLYEKKYKTAAKIIGERYGYYTPDGGFYLWLEVGDGEEAALTLWTKAGIRVIPGEYLAQNYNGYHPGKGYIRLALVNDNNTTAEALKRLCAVLN